MFMLQANGTVTVSLDGNFGLVRKSNAGKSLVTPLYENAYFVDIDETNSFVDSYSQDKSRDKVSLFNFRLSINLEFELISIYFCTISTNPDIQLHLLPDDLMHEARTGTLQ
jgi:hypothetical protein